MKKEDELYLKGILSEMAFKKDTHDELYDLPDENSWIGGPEQEYERLPQAEPDKGQGHAFKHNTNLKGVEKGAETELKKKIGGKKYDQSMIDKYFDNFVYDNGGKKRRRDSHDPNKFGIIQVDVALPTNNAQYKNPCYTITMLNIDKEDCQKIYESFGARQGYTYNVYIAPSRVDYMKNGLTFLVEEKNIDLWKEHDLNKLIEMLKSFKKEDGTSKYFPDPEFENNLRQYFSNRLMTKKDISNYLSTSFNNNIELFNAFIEAENDEMVQRFIKMYGRLGLIQALARDLKIPTIVGHMLSLRNIQLVLGSGRKTGAGEEPTFVLSEHMWHTFGRIVKPNAVPFLLYAPIRKYAMTKNAPKFTSMSSYEMMDVNGNPTKISSLEDVEKVLFLGKKWEDLNKQERISAQILCNYVNPSSFQLIKEYDVSDTEVVNPDIDPFTKEAGLVNRFTGQLNQLAIDQAREKGLDNGKFGRQETGETSPDAFKMNMETKTAYALQYLDEYCEAQGIEYKKVEGDNSMSVINAMRSIAEQNIAHRKKQNVDMLADDAIYAACVVNEIALDVVNTLTHRGKMSDPMEFSQFIRALEVICNILSQDWKQKMVKTTDNAAKPKNSRYIQESTETQSPFKHFSLKELIKLGKEIMQDMPQPQSFNNSLNENFMKYCGIDIFKEKK